MLQKTQSADVGERIAATNEEDAKLNGAAPVFVSDDKKNAESGKAKEGAKRVMSGDPKYKDIPLTTMRETIAKRLSSSKQNIPHYYLTSEIKMDELLKLVISCISPFFFLSFYHLLELPW